jgi:hypothetical protein
MMRGTTDGSRRFQAGRPYFNPQRPINGNGTGKRAMSTRVRMFGEFIGGMFSGGQQSCQPLRKRPLAPHQSDARPRLVPRVAGRCRKATAPPLYMGARGAGPCRPRVRERTTDPIKKPVVPEVVP